MASIFSFSFTSDMTNGRVSHTLSAVTDSANDRLMDVNFALKGDIVVLLPKFIQLSTPDSLLRLEVLHQFFIRSFGPGLNLLDLGFVFGQLLLQQSTFLI
uniref:(northern house mosquito) hypothetical protein n=1 Tax=Culex pipiens TaxID=7175 RepID=A0A8D8GJG8_CULPI